MYVQRCKTFKKHFKEIVKVKFKKMTQKQRDYGKVIAIAAIALIILMGMLNSCTIYKQPAMKITSVLAVTAEGDTLKLPIDVIRPIYNYNNYPRSYYNPYNNFYYSPYRYYPSYNQNYSGGGYSSNNNNSSNSSNSNNSSGTAIIRPGSSSITPPPNPTATNNPRKKN